MLKEYQELLKNKGDISIISNYLNDPFLFRLKNIGYFCGMDYASKDIYDFSEYINRYDHSVNVALITSMFTSDPRAILAGLYHDIATPCFSHVIDYMNKDYQNQESTEEYTADIILKDTFLIKKLKELKINVEDIINFKKHSIVDLNRPMLCADRVDGIILNSIGWTKNITFNEIKEIIDDLILYKNEDNNQEIGFKTLDVAKKAIWFNNQINKQMHSNEDIYMMELLANIVRYALDKKYLNLEDLYYKKEQEILNYLDSLDDACLKDMLYKFKNLKKIDITSNQNILIKNRNLKPIINFKRVI